MKNGYYGSTRIILRQSFEMLMIGKCSEYDRSLLKIWKDNKAHITHVWNYLDKKKLKKEEFKKFYHEELCKFTHHTSLSQQYFLLPTEDTKEFIDKLKKSGFYMDYHHTLDLIFVLENMLFHLSNILHNKTKRWYLGYEKDPFGDYLEIRECKKEYIKLKNSCSIMSVTFYDYCISNYNCIELY